MTDKEFKRLSRSQLIDIIYQLQLKQEELTEDNEKLARALADKRFRIQKAGNLAEASLEIHNVMQTAQDAAEHYLEEIKQMVNDEKQRILKKANDKAAAILANAQQEAAAILAKAHQEAEAISAQAKKENPAGTPAGKTIPKGYR